MNRNAARILLESQAERLAREARVLRLHVAALKDTADTLDKMATSLLDEARAIQNPKGADR